MIKVGKMSLELKKRYKKIMYTLKHKKAFLQVEKQLRGKNTWRGYAHDIDKPFLYLAFWLKLEDVQKIHRSHSKHHVRNNLPKSRDDLIDTIIDWECARITKPDKPLNAYETLLKFYSDKHKEFLPLIKELLPEQIKNLETSLKSKNNEINCHYNSKMQSFSSEKKENVSKTCSLVLSNNFFYNNHKQR